MKQKLVRQARSLLGMLQHDNSPWCNNNLSLSLNSLRDALLLTLPEQERNLIARTIAPLEIDLSDKISVNRSEALRLANQLVAMFDDEEQTTTDTRRQNDHVEVTPRRLVPPSQRIFIIHGHDATNTLRLRNLLKKRFHLEPIILAEKPGRGRALIEKFEQEAIDASFAFALLTPDDIIKIGDEEHSQARPNVIFELGWFYGRLGRDRVCILFKEGARIHSDLDGVLRIQFKESVEEKMIEIEQELQHADLI